MIATKILGLTAAVSKSKKLKIALLLAEVALFTFALCKDKKDHKQNSIKETIQDN
ncbi:hypothetical protein [Polaribacter sp. M15]